MSVLVMRGPLCFPNAGGREVPLLWFQRGIKATTQNQTSWGSLHLSPPRPRRSPLAICVTPCPTNLFAVPPSQSRQGCALVAGIPKFSHDRSCGPETSAAPSWHPPLRGKERGAFKAGGEEPPPGGVSVSTAAATAPRSPSPPPQPSLALGARGCAARSPSPGLPAGAPPAAPPRGPPLPLPAHLPPAEGKDSPRRARIRAAFPGVCSLKDGRDRGWARDCSRLGRRKSKNRAADPGALARGTRWSRSEWFCPARRSRFSSKACLAADAPVLHVE